MSLRVIFMGTPDFSVPTLIEIIGQGWDVVACYSQPPRKAGRGLELKKTPVHEAAESLGIPVFTPTSLKSEEEQKRFRCFEADVLLLLPMACCCQKRFWTLQSMVVLTAMPRCCLAGVELPRSTGRSWLATKPLVFR